jgi:cellulose biosynthesis protein BcsQ
MDTSIITVMSGASTGKTFLSWNLSHCFAKRGYKVSVINLDRGYSANVFFGVPVGEQALKNINNIDINEDIFEKAYVLNDNLRVFTGEICSTEKIDVEHFFQLINFVQAKSDITIIDFSSDDVNEVLEMSILHSNLNLVVFDIDNMHYNLNLKFLEKMSNLNFRKTIAVINNAFMDSNEVKNTEELLKEKEFKSICIVRNDGLSTYNSMHTDSCTYFETENKEFKKDMDILLDSMKSKQKKKSFFKKILGI